MISYAGWVTLVEDGLNKIGSNARRESHAG